MRTMTGRDRLLATLKGEKADRCPATVHQWQSWHLANIMGVRDEIDAFEATGLDAVVYAGDCMLPTANPDWIISETARERGGDEAGVFDLDILVRTPAGTLSGKAVRTPFTTTFTEYLFKNPEDIHLFQAFCPVPVYDPEALILRKRRLGDLGILRTGTNGPQGSPWQDACFWYGTEAMIYRAFDDPVWTHEWLRILQDKKLEFYERNLKPNCGVFEMIETGGGAASNTVISPNMFEEFCLPYDIEQHAFIRDCDPGIAISYHTCGGMMRILDLIGANGCSVSETLSPVGCGGDIREGDDEREVKSKLGSKVLLMGGFNQIQILTDGTEADIRDEVLRCFRAYGGNGGYIMMCSDHFFHAGAGNLLAYGRAVRELCRY